MFKYVNILFIFLLLCISTYGQNFPDYKERSFDIYRDTLKAQSFSITGSEGAIDPEEYLIGPGDVLFLSISGLEENSFKIPVDHEGNIYIPKVGGIELKNLTLAAAKNIIHDKLNLYFKDVDIFLTLADFKKIKVALIGDVIKPSTFILPGNARLLDLITISSGLNITSNYRDILIKNDNGSDNRYDLLAFLRYGNKQENPFLREGDIVIVDKVDKIVTVSGIIKYPGSYEFVEGETSDELIQIAGGLLSKARKDSIEIISFDENGKTQISTYYSYNEIQNNKILLKPQDHVIIRQVPEYMVDRYIDLQGHVKYPGFYKINKGVTTLFDIIHEAGGFDSEAALSEATIVRSTGTNLPDPEYERLKLIPRAEMTDDEYDYLKAKSRQRIGKIVVDFEELFVNKNMKENIVLVEGDIITIPREKNYIVMLGQVISPGNIVYNPDYSYEDYIELAGGYGWRAVESEVRIIKVKTGEWIYAEDDMQLEPGDAIWIPEDPPGPKFWDVFTASLNILGQVAAIVAAVIAVVIASR